jgi:hypothetical protein
MLKLGENTVVLTYVAVRINVPLAALLFWGRLVIHFWLLVVMFLGISEEDLA